MAKKRRYRKPVFPAIFIAIFIWLTINIVWSQPVVIGQKIFELAVCIAICLGIGFAILIARTNSSGSFFLRKKPIFPKPTRD